MNGLLRLAVALLARAVGWDPAGDMFDPCVWCGEPHPPACVVVGEIELAACPNQTPGSLFYVQQ